ncbi:MAG: hypothetical protein IJ129_02310 [Ruminococcus sp.]|nr:hypothetical protein [Ruminococcus sp.]
MEEKSRIFTKHTVILMLIIVLQLGWSVYGFFNLKQGLHSDEIWSYGLSNSYYKPFFGMKKDISAGLRSPEGERYTDWDSVVDNMCEWVDGKELHDYITVQKGERFAYGSVYYNQSLDYHPPLYYWILHTVCSFTPDTFSLWQAFSLNLVFMALAQIFLYLLMELMTGSKALALITCFGYGASSGAMSTMMFLRQYNLATMLTVAYVYFCAKLFFSYDMQTGVDLKKRMPPVLITLYLMCMTNYSIILFAGAFTALMCAWLLFKKRIKQMFIYGLSSAAAVGLFLITFSAVLRQMEEQGDAEKHHMLTFDAGFRRLINYILTETLGIPFSIYHYTWDHGLFAVLVVVVVLSIPLCFLFRNEEWFKRLAAKVKGYVKEIPHKLSTANYVPIFVLAGCVSVILLLAKNNDIAGMGLYADRFIMMLMPFVFFFATIIVQKLLGIIPKVKKAVPVLLAAGFVFTGIYTNVVYPTPFYNIQPKNYVDLSKLTKDKKVVAVLDPAPGKNTDHKYPTNSWQNTLYAVMLRDCDKVWYDSPLHFEDNYDEIKAEDPDYALIPAGSIKDKDKQDQIIELMENTGYVSDAPDNFELQESFDEAAPKNEGASKDLDPVIRKLSGKDDYEIVSCFTAQGGYFAVIKLH